MVSNTNYAAFEWQFNEKGNSFTLSRQDNSDDTLKIVPFSEVQCYKYSGIYEVLERKKSLMKFVSRSTMGYEGKEVEIVIEEE